VLVVVLASLLTGLSSVVLPLKLRNRSVPFVVVAPGTAGLLAAVLAIPSGGSAATSPTSPSETPGAAAPASPASQVQSDPMTATLDFDDPFHEAFTIPRSLLHSLAIQPDDVTAEWIYQHGGASASNPVLILQGKTESAVIIKRLRVIDVERSTPPSDAVLIFPDGGGGGVMAVRYFEIKMSDPPQVIPRRGSEDPDGHRDPAVKLPVKVSNSDPEQFVLDITGPPCFCDWRLGIDWESGQQRGTMIIDRGFGKIRSDTVDPKRYDHSYALLDCKWENMR
jgi:hypothetical protein